MDERQLRYIFENMIGEKNYFPSLEKQHYELLELCQSKLEVMYLMGIATHLHHTADYGEHYPNISMSLIDGEDDQMGFWFLEPWNGFCPNCNNGPSALLVVPQYQHQGGAIHHDFGMFTGDDNGSPTWAFWCAVEVDGYGVHKDRRSKDIYRDSHCGYKVVRVREEDSSPLKWFGELAAEECGCCRQETLFDKLLTKEPPC